MAGTDDGHRERLLQSRGRAESDILKIEQEQDLELVLRTGVCVGVGRQALRCSAALLFRFNPIKIGWSIKATANLTKANY
jgi:hypothetical protein